MFLNNVIMKVIDMRNMLQAFSYYLQFRNFEEHCSVVLSLVFSHCRHYLQ